MCNRHCELVPSSLSAFDVINYAIISYLYPYFFNVYKRKREYIEYIEGVYRGYTDTVVIGVICWWFWEG
jgi:hypothetical protein